MALSSTPPLSPFEGRRLLGVLPYTPEGVAMPAYAAGDTSTVYLCSSASVLFCSSDSAFGAYGIEISRAAASPDQVAGDIDIY